jgi:hypothetical protein
MNLAPNGKPSNLTPEQYRLVRTPAFKKWFGDWEKAYETGNYDNVSKVIDEQTKEPLRVYRGDINNYNVFDKNYSQYRRFYFTDKYDVAKTYTFDVFLSDILNKNVYTGRVKEYFLNIRNLYVDKFPKKQEMINSGSILKNSYDPLIEIDEYLDYHSNIYVVFEPNQIKLADGTNTTFDNNDDIRYAGGGKIDEVIVYRGVPKGYKNISKNKWVWVSEDKDFASIYGGDDSVLLKFKMPKYLDILDADESKFSKLCAEFEGVEYDYTIEYEEYKYEPSKEFIDFLKSKGYDGFQNNENILIFDNKKLIQYSEGGEITLTTEQVEKKLGRKLHWWDDDVVSINGIEYKKVFLKPEYKRL